MSVRFEKVLPWAGVLAGIGWILGNLAPSADSPGDPDAPAKIRDNLPLAFVSQEGHALMAIGLILFAVAVRARLRSGESTESSYSGVAYGGLLIGAAAELQKLALVQVTIAAAQDKDAAVEHLMTSLDWFSWWPLLLSASVAMVAIGLGGLRTAQLPKWFCIATLILGILGTLGGLNVPPGGLMLYFLLPVWLMIAAIVVARRASAPSHALAG